MGKTAPNPHERLALLRAEGKTFVECAEVLGVSDRTCKTWSRKPYVIARIREIREDMTDEAIGLLRTGIRKALKRVETLIDSGTSEDSVKLSAARGWVQDMVALSKYSELERRIEALEAKEGGPVANVIGRTDRPH